MTITTVPFAALVATDEINARAASKEGLDELAASIAAKGLIQPLAVRPSAGSADRYEIIDGRRRYLAMQRLVKERGASWTKQTPVPVLVRNEDDAEALETSLLANTVRLPMHPVDQHAVYARLAAAGASVADLAARFGQSERTIKQRLALGSLAEPIRDAWRKGKIEADTAQAFCLEPRQDLQVAAFERLKKSKTLSAWGVRGELQGARVSLDRVQAPVLERYLAAGGTTTESLFSEDRYADDHALLKKLEADWKAERTAALRAELLAEGWAWVADATDLPRSWRWEWEIVNKLWSIDDAPEDVRMRHHALEEQFETAEPEDCERIEREIEQLEQKARRAAFSAEQRARCGVVLEENWQGEIELVLGVVRPDGATATVSQEDEADDFDDADEDADELVDAPAPAAPVVEPAASEGGDLQISGALRTDLRRLQTEAIARALGSVPDVALRLAVAALHTVTYASPCKLQIEQSAHDRQPTGNNFLRAWSLAGLHDRDGLLQEVTRLVAGAMALSDTPAPNGQDEADAIVGALPGGLYLELMREAFDGHEYFRRARKAHALAAIEEIREAGAGAGLAPEDVLAGMTKGDLAEAAAEAAAACGWLPAELRHPNYAIVVPVAAAA